MRKERSPAKEKGGESFLIPSKETPYSATMTSLPALQKRKDFTGPQIWPETKRGELGKEKR